MKDFTESSYSAIKDAARSLPICQYGTSFLSEYSPSTFNKVYWYLCGAALIDLYAFETQGAQFLGRQIKKSYVFQAMRNKQPAHVQAMIDSPIFNEGASIIYQRLFLTMIVPSLLMDAAFGYTYDHRPNINVLPRLFSVGGLMRQSIYAPCYTLLQGNMYNIHQAMFTLPNHGGVRNWLFRGLIDRGYYNALDVALGHASPLIPSAVTLEEIKGYLQWVGPYTAQRGLSNLARNHGMIPSDRLWNTRGLLSYSADFRRLYTDTSDYLNFIGQTPILAYTLRQDSHFSEDKNEHLSELDNAVAILRKNEQSYPKSALITYSAVFLLNHCLDHNLEATINSGLWSYTDIARALVFKSTEGAPSILTGGDADLIKEQIKKFKLSDRSHHLLTNKIRFYTNKTVRPQLINALRCLMNRERVDPDVSNPLPYLPAEIWGRIANASSTLQINPRGQLTIEAPSFDGRQETVVLEHGLFANRLLREAQGLPKRMLHQAASTLSEDDAAVRIQRAYRQFKK